MTVLRVDAKTAWIVHWMDKCADHQMSVVTANSKEEAISFIEGLEDQPVVFATSEVSHYVLEEL